jgi:hypothetical protein
MSNQPRFDPTTTSVEELAKQPRAVAQLPGQLVEAVAELAILYLHQEIRANPPPGLDLRSLQKYGERSATDRRELCAHVMRVISAMHALGMMRTNRGN